VAQVLTLTRQDGTTKQVHASSPYLAVLFEEQFHRLPEGATDMGWMAFYDEFDRAPESRDELLGYLKQFIALDATEYEPPDPTATAPNGTEPDTSSPS